MNMECSRQVEGILSQASEGAATEFECVKSKVDTSSLTLDITSRSFDGAVIEDSFLTTAAYNAHSSVTEKNTRTEFRLVKSTV